MDNVAKTLALLALTCALGMSGVSTGEPSGAKTDGEPVVESGGGDDWDWSAVPGMDDTPVIAPPAGAQTRPATNYVAPREVENAYPDFEAAPRQAYAVFKDVPPFEVIPSQRDPGMHPCSNCHQWVKGNPQIRNLKQPHDSFKLEHGLHGKGRFWCFTCHDMEGAGGLKTLEGEKLDFNDAYILCSQCHSKQARDWVYGAHGKRVSGWQEKRQVLNCTACHYQHRPAIKPRPPKTGPHIRMGLERPAHWVSQDQRPAPDHGNHEGWKASLADPVSSDAHTESADRQQDSQERGDDEKS